MNGLGIQTTKEKGQELSEEQRRGIRQIDQLYQAMEAFEAWQKTTVTNQNKELENQTRMLENQQRILDEIKKWQQNHPQ